MMRLFFTILLLFVISSFAIYTQNTSVTGTITDAQTGDPVAGVNIRIDAVSKIFTSDENGRYKIDIFPGEYVIRLKLMGYETLVSTVNITNADTEFDFVLTPDPVLMGQGVTVTSTKAPVMRSNIETSVPVDIIDAQEIQESGKRELSQVLMTLVPSFISERQTFSDATDHIDPATLRSLGPDQVLVLVNGKRRHTTSLVNVTPIIGRGSVGTDLNAIPVSSIERIEILRDGASAQYGSDAIAGVINIIIKDDPQSASITATAGQTIENDGQHLTVGTNFGFGHTAE